MPEYTLAIPQNVLFSHSGSTIPEGFQKRGTMSEHEFSRKLKSLRKKRSLTQKELGDKLGIGQTTIANYEQGARFPDRDTLIHIADIFAVSLDELLGRTTVASQEQSGRNSGTATLKKSNPKSSENLTTLRNEFFACLQNNDIEQAKSLILTQAEEPTSIPQIYQHVFEPVLLDVGTLWEQGTLDVYTEHLISQTIKELMAVIKSMAPKKPPRGLRFLALAASGELHEIGLQMISDFLYLDGWETLFVGTYLPTQEGLKAIHRFDPHVVGISVTMDYNVDGAKNLIGFIRSHLPPAKQPKIIVGGGALQRDKNLWKTLGADATLQSLSDVNLIEQLISFPNYLGQ